MSKLDAVTDWAELAKKTGFSSRELARACEISPRQLRRYFSIMFSKSPQDWLDEMRLNLVASRLQTVLAVKAIAHELHFKTVSHLSHRFKDLHGCCPSEFRRRLSAQNRT